MESPALNSTEEVHLKSCGWSCRPIRAIPAALTGAGRFRERQEVFTTGAKAQRFLVHLRPRQI